MNDRHNSPPPESFPFADSIDLYTWRSELTDRLRVLLHTKPLLDLKRSDNLRSVELRHYDSLALAIKIWDLIVENVGLDSELDRRRVRESLTPLLVAMDRAAAIEPDAQRHQAIVGAILSALTNDDDGCRPFTTAYQDLENGQAVVRQLEFRLLWDYHHPAGGTVLRLSNEAINLYLRAWDLDIEDAQAAAEAVVFSQLQRGKFEEAAQSARNARLQSLRYWDKIMRILRDTRRDVRRVDWQLYVPQLLGEALLHIKTRTDMEASILDTARERLDVLEVDSNARPVAEVCRIVEECRQRHFALHGQLMGARNTFLDEQERQVFRLSTAIDLPALAANVLEPLLAMHRPAALKVLDDAAAPLLGAIAPQIVSLADLVTWMLQPKRGAPADECPLEEADLVHYASELLRFPEEIRRRGDSLLQDIEHPTRLTDLLAAVSEWNGPHELQEYLVVATLHRFAPELGEISELSVHRDPSGTLQTEHFFGDELILAPGNTFYAQ
ncbi:hypothetical protein [Anatilimnocola floriformis]|uniref:hypothetical protein n=1 Tax=Anatilimnocola floriformis TaxID=2948575 RepID=UPI0020C3E929|nr:hypothetical protein [Anatilimnocola floriformis]